MSKASFRFGWVAALLLSALLLKVKAQSSTAQTDCVGGTLFTVVRGDNSNFDQAFSKCSALDPPNKSVLAAIRNAAHFDAVVAILDSSEDRYWIGLKDPNGNAGDGNSDTSRFEYVAEDQTGISGFIDVGSGNGPWNGGQPNNIGGNQDCGAFFQFGSDFFFNDDECTRSTSYVCSSDCDSIPTTSPTNPTTSPTNPTTSPTNPTTSPTNPTTSPTNPTTSPTNPTTSPTNPTTSPTNPTTSPTNPTLAPTPPTTSPTNPTTSPTPPLTETTDTPTKNSENSTNINAGVIIGILLPILALASLFAFMVIKRDDFRKRFGKTTVDSDDTSTFKKELMMDIQNKKDAGATVVAAAQPEFSLDQFIKPGANVDHALGKASAPQLIPTAAVVNKQPTNMGFLVSKQEKSESASKSIVPRPALSSSTLVKKKKEKADEDEFEALLANNGKKRTNLPVKSKDEEEFDALIANNGKTSSLKVSKADEEEFEAILSGATKKKSSITGRKAVASNPGFKKNSPVPPPASNEARPQSTYLTSVEENTNRKSIFRPSSLFLSKAKRDKAMKKQSEKEMSNNKAATTKTNLDIDDDI